ncbi:Rv3654c family TadE-like protein [Streptomyces sp. NPDC007883]|uniref:Rv3654c family TadE-like protein n=1 Tax=Streptomyces sp. NPDC007883 TaxID=3155116 RepID=UPI0033D30A1E
MRGRDRGSATVWAAMAACAMSAVFAVVLAMGQVVVARHRAGAAADLAALAAADRALEGAGPACAQAARVARAQRAVVVRCAVAGEIADVSAAVALGPYRPEVRSRAGPPAPPGLRDVSSPRGTSSPPDPDLTPAPPGPPDAAGRRDPPGPRHHDVPTDESSEATRPGP